MIVHCHALSMVCSRALCNFFKFKWKESERERERYDAVLGGVSLCMHACVHWIQQQQQRPGRQTDIIANSLQATRFRMEDSGYSGGNSNDSLGREPTSKHNRTMSQKTEHETIFAPELGKDPSLNRTKHTHRDRHTRIQSKKLDRKSSWLVHPNRTP